MNGTPPLLAYDGDCGFCAYWVRYWQRLTGERVHYAPYQEIAADAAFRVLARAPGRGIGQCLYRRLPGFAGLAETTYTLIAHHREAAYRWSRLLDRKR